jgi:hypothetical protein
MPSVKITSSTGGAFDCYVALPAGDAAVPAVVIASAVHGVEIGRASCRERV